VKLLVAVTLIALAFPLGMQGIEAHAKRIGDINKAPSAVLIFK
jgi:hypothetical protein